MKARNSKGVLDPRSLRAVSNNGNQDLLERDTQRRCFGGLYKPDGEYSASFRSG
jgi:hypothetical protein